MKHTPGPWTVEPFGDFDKDIVILEPRVTVDNDDVDHKEAAANACLIAMAPELLEALVELRDYAGSMPTLDTHGEDRFLTAARVIERAERAIAKACGK